MNDSTKFYDFDTNKLLKTPYEKGLTLILFVNSCSPEAATKLTTFFAL